MADGRWQSEKTRDGEGGRIYVRNGPVPVAAAEPAALRLT